MEDRWFCDWTPSERWPHYTRANAGEVLPTPASPLGQTFTWDNGMAQGWRDGYVRQGLYAEGEMSDVQPEACGFFGGFFYVNLSNVRMQGVRNPAVTVDQLDLAFFGGHPGVPPYEPHPDDEKPELTEGILAHMGWVMSATEWPEIDEDKAATIALRAARPDLGSLSPAELVARAREIQPLLISGFETHCVASSSSGIAPGILFAVGEAIGDPTVPMQLIAGIGDVDSAEPSFVLWDLSRRVRESETLTTAFDAGVSGVLERIAADGGGDATTFLAAWDDFLVRFGSRGPNEWEIHSDSWETRPEIALALLDRVRFQTDDQSPTIRNQAKASEREAVTADVRAKLAEIGDDELSGQFEAALVAANMMAFRERTKTNLVRVINELRVTFDELGRQLVAAGHLDAPKHVYMVTDDELDALVADPAAMRAPLAQRYSDYEELATLEPPFFIYDGEVPPLSSYAELGDAGLPQAEVGEVLQGVPGCPGTVRGTARVILDPTDPMALEPGDIMVAPGSSAIGSVGSRMTRAVPRTVPGQPGTPWSTSPTSA